MKNNIEIVKIIKEVCNEKNISVYDATLKGGKSPSAIYNLAKGRTQCSKVVTILGFCESAGITLSEFLTEIILAI